MKNWRSTLIRIARMGVSLILCLNMLVTNLVPVSAFAEGQTETYYSEEFSLGGITPAGGLVTGEQPLVDWCDVAKVEFYYNNTLVVSGDTLPRGASVDLRLDVQLKSTLIKECDADTTFVYTIPNSIAMVNMPLTPFYDPGNGDHLMNWSITNNVLTIQFTEKFYSDQGRNNVKCFVIAEGVLLASFITNGQVTYSFAGGSQYTIHFPVGAVTASKTLYSSANYNAISGKLTSSYHILINSEDALDEVVVTEFPGSFLTIDKSTYELHSGSRTGPNCSSQMTVEADGRVTIRNLLAKTNYYLIFTVENSLDALSSGFLESTDTAHVADRQNYATVSWKRGSETGAVTTNTTTYSHNASSYLGTVTKTISSTIPDAGTGKTTFNITIRPSVALSKLVVKDIPGLYWEGGVFTCTTTGQVAGADGIITIDDAKVQYYYFTYVVDFPYEAAANNAFSIAADAALRANTVQAIGYAAGDRQIATRSYTYTYPQITSRFAAPTKTVSKTVYVADDGRFLLDFSVTLPYIVSSSTYQNIFNNRTTFVDTLGDYFTLVKDSVKVSTVAVPEADITVSGQTFSFKMPSNYYSYSATTVTYTVEVDSAAVTGGKLKATEPEAPRTNTVKQTWEAPTGASGSGPEGKVVVTYASDLPAPTIAKSIVGTHIQYNEGTGEYYTNFQISFSISEPMDCVRILEVPGAMFAQDYTGGDWASKIQIMRGSTPYVGDPSDSYTYKEYKFYNIPAGVYTITFPAKIDFVANGLSYTMAVGTTSNKTNTARLYYTQQGGTEKLQGSASATITATQITLGKSGVARLDTNGDPVIVTIGGVRYAMVDWTIALTSTSMDLSRGKLIDTLFGRQCFAENNTANLNSFLDVYSSSSRVGYGSVSEYGINTIGSESYLQSFTYNVGSLEAPNVTYKVYKFVSYVREPHVPTTITAANQSVFDHPLFGRFTATAEVDLTFRTTGTVAPAQISKSLVKVDTTSNAPHATATWKSTIHVPGGTTVANSSVFVDHMNFARPASYFDLAKLNLSVAYADGSTPAPTYEAPTITTGADGVDRLTIKFTQQLTKSVVITYTTCYDNVDSTATSKKFINYSDYEYGLGSSGSNPYYVSAQDYWSVGRVVFEKAGATPRYDAALNQFVIDWEVTVDDALRLGMLTKITDTIPTGLTLIPESVQASPISDTVVVTVSGSNRIFAFTPTEKVTKLTFTTAIDAAYLSGIRTFTNSASLWNRAATSAGFANASAPVTYENLRTFTKTASEPAYNLTADRYEITWSIALSDKTLKTATVYIRDRLPAGVKYVEGSISASPNRLDGIAMAPDNRSFIITLKPGATDSVTITFKTSIDDDMLYQDAGNLVFKNYADLLAPNQSTVWATAEATVQIMSAVREFSKSGYAHYDEAEQKFVIDWVIALTDQARVGGQVILAETLPTGLTFGSVVVKTDEAGPTLTHQIKNMSADNRSFDIVYTPTLARSTVYLRTYIDAGELESAGTRTYQNTVNLMSADGRKIDTKQATVAIKTGKTFTKGYQPVSYNTALGKYAINWKLDLDADLFVGVPIIIEDTLPAGIALLSADAVTCTDAQQPSSLTYTQQGQLVKIYLTPSKGQTHLLLHTTIDFDNLLYTGTQVPEYTNTAKIFTAAKPTEDLGLHASSTCAFGLSGDDVLKKTGQQLTDSNRIVYKVVINKEGVDLANGAAEIVLSDILDSGVTILMDQVRVLNGATSAHIPAQDYQALYDSTTRELSFRLPNRLYLILEFEVLLNGTPNETVTLDNTIMLKGKDVSSSTGPLEFVVVPPKAGVSYDSDHLKIHKFDRSDTSKNLAGASFNLYEVTNLGSGSAQLISQPGGAATETDAYGILHLPSPESKLKANTLYYAVETVAPSGYLLNNVTKYYFFIPSENTAEAQAALQAVTNAGYTNVTVSVSPTLEISNVTDLKSRVVVNKVFVNGGGQQELLSGAKLEIWDSDRQNKIHSFTSGSVQSVLDNLKAGGADLKLGETYYLLETEAPAGYQIADPVSFTLQAQVVQHGDIDITIAYAEVTMKDEPTEVVIRKEDVKGKPLAGADLRVIDSNGNPVTSWTSAAGAHTVKGLSYGTIYGLQETAAPAGHIKTNEIVWFMLLTDNTVTCIPGTLANPPTPNSNWPAPTTAVTLKNIPQVMINKIDDTNDQDPVIGAVLELYAGETATGSPILTWNTDGTAYVVGQTLQPGKYTLHEKTTPKGYESATDITFTVSGTETQTIVINMVDPKITTTSLSGMKRWYDYNGTTEIDPQRDVTIELYRSDDPTKVLKTQVLKAATKDKNYEFTDLEIVLDPSDNPYTYHVREVSIPGYYSEVVSGGINNYKTRLTVHKQNASGAQLSGARFLLKDAKGDTVKDFVTADAPTVFTDLIGGTYTLEEITPPDGYATASPSTQTGVLRGDMTVTFVDPALDVKIKKVNASGGALAGASLELYEGSSATGTPYLTWTSTTSAYVPTKPLKAGAVYTLHEAAAPAGYLLAADQTFTVANTSSEQLITMTDATIATTTHTVTKVWNDDNDRDRIRPTEVSVQLFAGGVAQGAPVKLNVGNNWTYTWTSLLSKTPDNQTIVYTVDETVVPTGYTKTVEVNPQDITKSTITNRYTPIVRDVTVQKVWNDNNNIKNARPTSIQVALVADGVETGQTAILNGAGNWMHTWLDQPLNKNGVAIQYTVKEVSVPSGYVSKIAVDDQTKTIVVTNTYANIVVNKFRASVEGVQSTVPLGGARFEVRSQDKQAVVVPAFTMDANGTYTISGNLAPGSYWLVEVETPAGHYKADDVAFTVTGNDQPVSIYDNSTAVAIRKIDKDGGSVAGATLGVFDGSNKVLEFTTSLATQVIAKGDVQVGNYTGLPAGTIVIEGILEAGKSYTLKELSVPATYLKAADVPFTVNNTSTITNVSMTDQKIELISIEVTKVWDDLNTEPPQEISTPGGHPTITIELYRSDDLTTPHRVTTLSEGTTKWIVDNLEKTDALGAEYTYTVEELPVEGYLTVVNGYSIRNIKTTVSIKKLAGNTTAIIPGAELEIWDKDGAQKIYGPFTTGDNAVNLTGILTGGVTYQLKEVGLPKGFVQAAPVTFTVDSAAKEVIMRDEPTVVLIQKINADGNLIPGATLEIRDAGGNTVKTLTTTNQTQIISWNNQPIGDYSGLGLASGSIVLEGILEAGKSYKLVETVIPSGYKQASPVDFTVNTDGSIKYVPMTDPTDTDSYEVLIRKLDQYDDPVIGAGLKLRNTKTNTDIASWTTTDEPYRISLPSSLDPIYELSEVSAPEGYTAAAPITFAVHRDADAVIDGITMVDILVDRNVHGEKTWVDRGLTGPHPTIIIDLYQDGVWYNNMSRTLNDGTTTYSFLHLPAVDTANNNKKYVYTVKERFVAGYATEQNGYDFTNTATQVTVHKVDEDGVPVPGAVLVIYDLNNQEVIRWNTTDENPKVITGILNANADYTLVEETVPMGYTKAANQTIAIDELGSIETVTMTNVRVPWAVSIHKVATQASTEVPLPGAALSVYDADNLTTPVKSWNTSTSNPAVFTDLDPTKNYVLKETTTPAGFIPAADIPFNVTMGANGTYEITMRNLQTAVNVNKLEGQTPLAGAWMEIREGASGTGTAVRRWLSDGTTKEITGLEVEKTYTLHEILPPVGYATNPNGIKFEVSVSGQITVTGTVANTRTTTPRESITEIGNTSDYQCFHHAASVDLTVLNNLLDIKIRKVDDNSNLLGGAELELYKGETATGTPIASWTSSDTVAYVPTIALEAGAKYTLHEKSAPVGYLLAADQTFTVLDQSAEQVVTMIDPTIAKTSLKVVKAWDDDGNRDNIRPAEVFVQMYADGDPQGSPVKLDDSNSWTYTWNNLLSRTPENAPINYTVDETAVPSGYTKSIGTNGTTTTITNSYLPAQRDVKVLKVWNDNNNLKFARPASVTVELLADGVTTSQTAQLNVGNSWTHTWPNMPTKNQGVEIVYTVREVIVPTGYVSQVSVDDSTKLITVTNTYANVVVSKFRAAIDGTTSTAPLGGAKFEVRNEDKSAVAVPEFTMSTAGTYTISGDLAPGNYWLVETFTPSGHYKTDDVAFTVTGNDQPVNIYDRSTVVAIRKLGEGNANLPGAELGIFNSSGNEVLRFTTTASTQIIAKDNVQVGSYTSLPAGTVVIEGILEAGVQYTLKELTVPATYLKAADKPFTVNGHSEITHVSMVDTKITLDSITVNKNWNDLGQSGVNHPTITIELYRSDDNVNPYRTQQLSNGTNSYTFTGLEKTDALGSPYTYRVEELEVPGYISSVNGFTITNTRTSVSVKKLAGSTGTLISGAQLEIRSADGTQLIHGPFNTTTSATNIVGVLTGGVSYQLVETGLPKGFVQAAPVTFTMDAATKSIEMIDEPTVVVIQKKNTSGDLLAGATLEIRDSSAAEVQTLTTTSATQIISWNNTPIGNYSSLNLPAGSIVLEGILEAGETYTLVETASPSGYQVATPVSFTVNTTGALKYVTMTDLTDDGNYNVTIRKLDQYNDPVIGATLTLTHIDGQTLTETLLATWTTDDTTYQRTFSLKSSLVDSYVLREITAPDGYAAAMPITFVVHRDALAVKDGITMVDTLVDRNVRGTKTWNDRSLTGPHPTIIIDLYQDGVWYNNMSRTLPDGTLTYAFEHLPAVDAANGNHKYVYTVKERPVAGYETVQNGYDFTNTATMVTVSKVDENDNLLPGVELAIQKLDGTEVIRWNTSDAGGNPKDIVGVLDADTSYKLVELTPPMGYRKAADQTFLVKAEADGSGQKLKMVNEKDVWKVTIQKVATAGSSPVNLTGVTLAIYDVTNMVTPVKSWNTSTNNPAVFTDLDPTKNYVLREEVTPAGYIPAVDIAFNVTTSINNQSEITVTNLQTAVNVEKHLNNSPLAGAWMEIREGSSGSGAVVRRWVSTGSAVEILGLEIGKTYTLHEILPPPGYVTNPFGITFEVFAEGKFVNLQAPVPNTRTSIPREQLVAIGNPISHQGSHNSQSDPLIIKDDPLDIKINKTDIYANGLAGATLELYKDLPLTPANRLETWVSSGSPHIPSVKLEVGKTYILHEAIAPAGYQIAPDMSITIDDVATTQTFTMEDPMTKVVIEKRDAASGSFVVGAQLTLTDNVTRQVVETWTTTGTAKVFEGVLVAGRSYTLNETITPINHYKADPITFTVETNGVNPTIVMIDSPIVIKISKLDEAGLPLGGVDFALYAGNQATGAQLENWSSTASNPHTLTTQLEDGKTYTVRELSTLPGYFTAPDLVFTVNAQRNPDGSAKEITHTIQNYETAVQVWMYDKQTNWLLPGAALTLTGPGGAPIDSWISGTASKLFRGLLEGETYTLTQTAVPSGFALADPITFTVPVKPTSSTPGITYTGSMPVYNVKMYSSHIYKFLKVEEGTGIILTGAELYIKVKGQTVAQWVSGPQPFEVVGHFEAGQTYTVYESKAPAGFLAENHSFTVGADGTMDIVKIINRHIPAPTPGPVPNDFQVTKIWRDNNNASGRRPGSITINLYQKATTDPGYPSTPYLTASMSGTGNTWRYTFASLPKGFDYMAQESPVSGYTVSYSGNGRTITNVLPGSEPTPTPFATPTLPVLDDGLSGRQPVGVRFVDGQWVYFDEYDMPLGVVPLTGDDSSWALWIAAALLPMIGILVALIESRRREKKRKAAKR